MSDVKPEHWLPVVGYEGLFEVSDKGRVKSLRRKWVPEDRILKPTLTAQGYLKVMLRITPVSGSNSRGRNLTIHMLVAAAFLGPAEGRQVCHIDGTRTNNTLTNLRYGTQSDNTADSVGHGTHNMARKTHCKRGHEFTPENTRVRSDGGRVCRSCANMHSVANYKKDPERGRARMRKSYHKRKKERLAAAD